MGISIREYCRRFGIMYSSLIGKEVGHGEPTVPLSSLDPREVEKNQFKRKR